VLCGNEFGWLQDGTRVWGGGERWQGHQNAIRSDLERRGLDFVEVEGSVEERVLAVRGWLERQLAPS
jgi:nicotinamide riboside kinase